MARISGHCWEPPGVTRALRQSGDVGADPSGVARCTYIAPFLIEGATSGTAGWVRIDPFEKSSRVESVLRESTVRRKPWTSAWGRHVGAF
ncbi:hypothetical protein AVEN_186879-1 [Araneus ventricosus]|uniref:Uncharacterized protein n=1 Tax=Araneus ventricosus TaxID=182803 RepID=A0A4Y2R541_ARAVE|nr:hypothetical protein AVEN_186879-1 [Araneus ventricosus]